MKQIPEFIKNAEKTQYAQQITEVFNVPNINELKKRLKERYPTVHKLFTGGFWHVPNLDVAIDKIATK